MSEFFLDRETREALEWDQFLSLVEVCSPLGFNDKQRIKPFLPGEERGLRRELKRTYRFKEFLAENASWAEELRFCLREIKDLRGFFRDAAHGGILSVTELFEVKRFLWVLKQIRELFQRSELAFLSTLKPRSLPALWRIFLRGGQSPHSFFLVDAYSGDLSHWRSIKASLERKLDEERTKIEATLTPLSLKLSRDLTVTIPREDKRTIREFRNNPRFFLQGETSRNLRFSLRRSPEELLWEKELAETRAKIEAAEKEVRRWLSRRVGEYAELLLKNAEKVAALDLLLAKADLDRLFPLSRPRILCGDDKEILSMKEGVHLPLHVRLSCHVLKFHPLTIELRQGSALITGANMSGKTVLLKTLGLNAALAQHGFLVPANSFSLTLRDFVFFSTRGKETDGLSAFGAEIMGLRRVLELKEAKGLLLIDELARGTNPEEGFAINAALLEYLKDKASLCLMASHFDGLAKVADVEHWQMAGLSEVTLGQIKKLVSSKDEGLIERLMSYKLSRVSRKKFVPHDALKISLLLGLNRDVVELAERFLEKFLP